MTPTDIYEVCSGGMMLLLMILVYRYIYMEPGLVSRRNNGLFAGGFLLTAFGVKLFLRRTEPAEILIPLVFFCLYVLLTRRKRRIRGMFLLLPISGYLFMLVAASTSFYCVITATACLPMPWTWSAAWRCWCSGCGADVFAGERTVNRNTGVLTGESAGF